MADRKKWKYATKKSVTGTPSSLPKVLHDSTANFGPWRENWPLFESENESCAAICGQPESLKTFDVLFQSK